MVEQATLPPPVAELLADTFPDHPVTALAATFGGFSNLSVLAHFGAVPCVIKAAQLPTKRADLRRELAMLNILRGRRLGAPLPLGFVEGNDWSILITARRPGTPGLRLYSRPPEQLAAPLAALGRTLARLHAAPLTPPPDTSGLLLAERAVALRAELDALPLPQELRGPLAAALEHEVWQPVLLQPVHGDAGLHNILWGGGRFSLLDWELAGWGDPRLDLAWVGWTLAFRGLPPACRELFLTSYGRQLAPVRELDTAADALVLGQIAALLARAAGRPAWEEWLRRARWTVEQAGSAGGT